MIYGDVGGGGGGGGDVEAHSARQRYITTVRCNTK